MSYIDVPISTRGHSYGELSDDQSAIIPRKVTVWKFLLPLGRLKLDLFARIANHPTANLGRPHWKNLEKNKHTVLGICSNSTCRTSPQFQNNIQISSSDFEDKNNWEQFQKYQVLILLKIYNWKVFMDNWIYYLTYINYAILIHIVQRAHSRFSLYLYNEAHPFKLYFCLHRRPAIFRQPSWRWWL